MKWRLPQRPSRRKTKPRSACTTWNAVKETYHTPVTSSQVSLLAGSPHPGKEERLTNHDLFLGCLSWHSVKLALAQNLSGRAESGVETPRGPLCSRIQGLFPSRKDLKLTAKFSNLSFDTNILKWYQYQGAFVTKQNISSWDLIFIFGFIFLLLFIGVLRLPPLFLLSFWAHLPLVLPLLGLSQVRRTNSTLLHFTYLEKA